MSPSGLFLNQRLIHLKMSSYLYLHSPSVLELSQIIYIFSAQSSNHTQCVKTVCGDLPLTRGQLAVNICQECHLVLSASRSLFTSSLNILCDDTASCMAGSLCSASENANLDGASLWYLHLSVVLRCTSWRHFADNPVFLLLQ